MLAGRIRLFDHFLVQIFRRQIRVVFPSDRVQYVRDLEAAKCRDILERFEHGTPKRIREVNDSFLAVAESHPNAKLIYVFSGRNLQHRQSLQGRNPVQRLMLLCKLPILQQVVRVEFVPFQQRL